MGLSDDVQVRREQPREGIPERQEEHDVDHAREKAGRQHEIRHNFHLMDVAGTQGIANANVSQNGYSLIEGPGQGRYLHDDAVGAYSDDHLMTGQNPTQDGKDFECDP